jgi:CubicO group peptidase (beta-lactamase class C family)
VTHTAEDAPAAWSRRAFLRTSAGAVAAAVAAPSLAACTGDAPTSPSASTTGRGPLGAGGDRSDPRFAALDARIEAAMARYAVPGAAVGVWFEGRAYLKAYGVTSVVAPEPVTVDTVFRIGSTTKTFTGTPMMRLVEAGKVDLDQPVRTYLTDFATSDPSVSAVVTVRQLLNHTAGWLGDDYQDYGPGADALARYTAGVVRLPQLTPVGSTEFYQNSGVAVGGRVVEVVNGTTYEKAVQDLVLDPLGLSHTRYVTDELVGYTFAGSHAVVDGKATFDPRFWTFPRSINATGGLMSTARDQLRWAQFHLGHVEGVDGRPVLSAASLAAMREKRGPGGTLNMELDGFGVNWFLRPTAEGVRIVEHGGNWAGQRSRFLLVPERDFAITVLTNSDGGEALGSDLCDDDWTVATFLGLHNPPAVPQTRTPEQLAPYVGTYVAQIVVDDAAPQQVTVRLAAEQGRLRPTLDPGADPWDDFAFYRDQLLVPVSADGTVQDERLDVVLGPDGAVQWLRKHGRMYRKTA